jgi:hypothetical protein
MTRWLVAFIAVVGCSTSVAQTDWTEESNRNAQVLLHVIAKYSPESASSIGVEGYDEEIFDLRPGFAERAEADLEAAAKQLEAVRAATQDVRVQQDLDILIAAAHDQIASSRINRKHLLPVYDLPQAIFGGFRNLLDERVPKERWPAAVVRLRRYVGREAGYEPITSLARARYEEAAKDPSLLGPWIVELQQNLDNQQRYLDGIEDLFKKSRLKGWQKDMQTLRRQINEYGEWIRSTVLPRARQTNRLPLEVYADNLKQFGVKMSPQELIDRASASFVETRSELRTLARALAAERGWKTDDYREVIRLLKKERIAEDQLLPFYRERLSRIEDILRRERLVTLPEREAVIRLATEAESAAQPAPHVSPPRLIGNTGEPAEFVLPVRNPNARPGAEMDDFTNDAVAWTLTAHEARPGHELQFAKMLERGVSIARVVFAFNSANVEGWALYAEAQTKEYLPLDGQVGVLQMRMMRAARAFLDPMLNLGLIQPEEALRFLTEEVVLSEPMAKQEVDRYTFRAPGQATAYFYGYAKLNALRTRVEIALADRFDRLAYHDFIISQGLLPFELIEKAVMEEFVPAQRAPARE